MDDRQGKPKLKVEETPGEQNSTRHETLCQVQYALPGTNRSSARYKKDLHTPPGMEESPPGIRRSPPGTRTLEENNPL
ncbi:hypothetical protein JTB14_034669 [Gonioctena quinquepunctata]|nr:hypothetical protein JTB14_034669 [Gonioctena quinquepunctata]